MSWSANVMVCMSDITSAENEVLENDRKWVLGKQQTVFYFHGKWPKISLWKTPDKYLIHRKTADNYEMTWKTADSHGLSP